MSACCGVETRTGGYYSADGREMPTVGMVTKSQFIGVINKAVNMAGLTNVYTVLW